MVAPISSTACRGAGDGASSKNFSKNGFTPKLVIASKTEEHRRQFTCTNFFIRNRMDRQQRLVIRYRQAMLGIHRHPITLFIRGSV